MNIIKEESTDLIYQANALRVLRKFSLLCSDARYENRKRRVQLAYERIENASKEFKKADICIEQVDLTSGF
jgi:hypothetical protein